MCVSACERECHITFCILNTHTRLPYSAGRKTTHRVCNSLHFNFRESDEEAVIQVMRSPQAFKQLIAAFNREDERLKRVGGKRQPRGAAAAAAGGPRTLLSSSSGPKIRLYAFHVDFARYLAESFHFQLSLGFQGLIAALMSCRSVDVYGFAAGPSEGYAHHYWSGVDATTFNAGRDLKEWHAIRALASLGLVRLRDSCVEECHAGRQHCAACANRLEQEREGTHVVASKSQTLSEDAYLAKVGERGGGSSKSDCTTNPSLFCSFVLF